MKQEKKLREFFSTEITLKLYQEFDLADYESRISFVREEAEKVRQFFEEDVFEKKLNNRIAHCYLDAEKYAESIPHLEREVELSRIENNQFYFFPIWLLIRSNRETGNFLVAFKWSEKAIDLFEHANSFDKLNVFKEYADLVSDSGEAFNPDYSHIIEEIITDLGFSEKLEDPIKTIYSMVKSNRIWNRKLGEIHLKKDLDQKEKLRLYQEYRDTCEIGWYRDYALRILNN
jgi:tetratricopeptide (TPR) repeat protein